MKKLSFYLSICLFFICLSQLFAADFWTKTSFPDNFIPINNCMVAIGNNIYVGTDGAGIYQSDMNASNWNRVMANTDDNPIRSLCNSKNYIFAASDVYIYRWDFSAKYCDVISYFVEMKDAINCIGCYGNSLYVGTRTGLYKSDDEGMEWVRVNNEKFGDANVISFCISQDGTIFIAVLDGKTTSIYKSTDGNNWEYLNEWFDYIDQEVAFKTKDEYVYIGTGNFLYASVQNKNNWGKISPDLGGAIKKILFDSYSNIFLLTYNGIIYLDPNIKEWIIGKSTLILYETIKDIAINGSNYLLAATEHSVYISSQTLDEFFEPPIEYLTGDIRLIDHNNNPLANKSLSIYKNDTRIGDFSTGSDGRVSLTSFNFIENDRIKVEYVPWRENSNKPGKEIFFNTRYEVKLDNAKMDNTGFIWFDTLKKVSLQDIKVNHTTIMPNIIIGIDWDAKPEFLDTVASFMRRMSDYLYDVTDGQLCLGKVAIYDAGVNFNTCDVKIYANNNEWPHASVGGTFFNDRFAHMPRMHYGNGPDNRNLTANDNWYRNSCGNMFTTIAHELGHYFFAFYDEYVFEPPERGNSIPSTYNYGFMDYQYGGELNPGGDAYYSFRSEMSNNERYTYLSSDMYKWTAQWRRRGKCCWAQFETDFERTYSGIHCPIIRPEERGITGWPSYVSGPYRNQPYGNVGQFLDVQIFDANNNSGEVNIACIYPDRSPAASTHCCIVTNNPDIFNNTLYQGLTSSNGRMKVLGVKVGERINVWNQSGQRAYFYQTTVSSVSYMENKKNILLEDQEIELEQVAGDFSFVPAWKFEPSGGIDFSLYINKSFNSPPVVSFPTINNIYVDNIFHYNDAAQIYSTNIDNSLAESGFINFSAYDDAGKYFAIPLFFNKYSYSDNFRSKDGSLQLLLDSINKDYIQTVSILTSNFPTSTNGLESDAERSGSLYSISAYPNDFVAGYPNTISINYNENDLKVMPAHWLRIYKWNEISNIWELAGGIADTASKSINTQITVGGTYGLFTQRQPDGVLDENSASAYDFAVYPNPADASTIISFNLIESSSYSIKLYNYFGREIAIIANRIYSNFSQKLTFDTRYLNPGVYFLKLEVNGVSEMKKLVIIR